MRCNQEAPNSLPGQSARRFKSSTHLYYGWRRCNASSVGPRRYRFSDADSGESSIEAPRPKNPIGLNGMHSRGRVHDGMSYEASGKKTRLDTATAGNGLRCPTTYRIPAASLHKLHRPAKRKKEEHH